MYFLYSLFLILLGVLLLPAFLYKAFRYQKRLPGFSQRMGRLPESLKFDGREVIWFHSCSVGETLSLQSLVRLMHERLPKTRFIFSTITKTGQQVAIQNFADHNQGNIFYFPIDFTFVARRVLDWIRPVMIVIVDTEIWPNIIHQASQRGIPVALINGRISPSSYRFYRWGRPILSRIFHNYKIFMMQSEEDAVRIRKIGAPLDKIAVSGNIKFDGDDSDIASEEKLVIDIRESFGLNTGAVPLLVVAGSTHPGEEQILLDVFQAIRRSPGLEETRLLLAPRHPERFDEVAQLAVRNGFQVRRRTNGRTGPQNSEVLLLDTIGELSAAYRLAAIAFIGGTLVSHGGHSIMEPARYSKAIVIGPYMENFRRIVEEFRDHGGLRQIAAGEENKNQQVQQLMEIFTRLLHNSQERASLGAAAHSILERNRGAAQRTCRKIAALYNETRMTAKCLV
jgi:3-deoxy-D-manno-octulosonic-acid transferase